MTSPPEKEERMNTLLTENVSNTIKTSNTAFENWKRRRVVIDSRILGGEPVFLGTRLSVRLISDRLNSGLEHEVKENYEYLSDEDIMFAKQY